MTLWICETCAVEHADTAEPPERCDICSDDRQWVPPTGQRWTTHDALRGTRRATLTPLEPGLHRLVLSPEVGIGQQTLLVATDAGLVVWEPPGYADAEVLAMVRDLADPLGGVAAVTASHPHLVGAAVTWSRALGAPYLVNRADVRWVRRPDEVIGTWHDVEQVAPGATLVQTGGHFPGSAVLHWTGHDGAGVLLVGDTIAVKPDRRWVSFMRSYVHDVPLRERLVRQVVGRVGAYDYDRLYGAFGVDVDAGARAVVEASAERYVGWLTDAVRDPDEVDLAW